MENLEMIRGDTLAFGFEVDGVTEIDAVYFSVKKTKNETEYVLQKSLNNGVELVEDGKYSVRVAPADTYNLEVGIYYYDLQIELNGDVFTVLYGTLTIETDITRDVVMPEPTPPEPAIKAGSYYLQLEQSGSTILEVVNFALESNAAFVVLFSGANTINFANVTTYTKTDDKVIINIYGVDYELTINGSTLYYEGVPLVYKPNFDVDYIKAVFEEVNNG